MSKWPSGHWKTEKSGHRTATEEILFLRRWYVDMISTNLEVIWEMSVKKFVTAKPSASTVLPVPQEKGHLAGRQPEPR